ncbi:MAG: hypothetical protein IJG68_07770 [Bacilli bacterium]|nr:hypothetical protein [Bacilli bacterium]
MVRNKKILWMIVLSVFCFLSSKNVYAEEYYTNGYGVSFDRAQYDFFTEFFYDGYQAYMTQEMLDEYDGFDFENTVIEKTGLCPNQTHINPGNQVSPQDFPYLDTYAKEIKMAKACNSFFCRVSCTVTWHGTPTVQSHDVIGAYLNGPTRFSTPATMYTSSNGSGYETDIVYDTDGYGAVVDIPNASDIIVSQSFSYTGTGLIFMSYQHAVSTVTLNEAKSFSIGLAGYGNVFIYPSNIGDSYDQMGGVYMTV